MILVVPKKTLTSADKKALLKKGYVVIECEKPESVRVISPETLVDKSDLFLSALSAIVTSIPINSSERFVYDLYKRLVPQKKEVVKPKIVTKPEPEPKPTVLKEPINSY